MTDLLHILSWGPAGWGDELAAGALLTLALAVATVPFGIALGFLAALARNSERKSWTIAGNVYTTVFRGLPELLTLFIVYYGAPILLKSVIETVQTTLGFEANGAVPINSFVAGMIALSLVFSSYASEVFLGALRSIARGQREAALALGLTPRQAMRLVVWPQLWRYALPGISNLWLILLKETSLVSVIMLSDMMRAAKIVVGVTKEPFFIYALVCFIYLGFAIVSSFVLGAVENWSNKGLRRAEG